MQTVLTASEFKATCLDIFDRVADGTLESVTITKRGRVVGVLHPPAAAIEPASVFGHLRGSVVIPAELDLTALTSEAFDAASGRLHR